MSEIRPKPVVLLVVSGWGVAAPSKGNALSLVETPNFKRLAAEYKTFVLEAAGEAVGLEAGRAGTLASGYRCLGTGNLAYQEKSHIDQAIADGSFFNKKALAKIAGDLQNSGGRLHLIGQISARKKHSNWEHLHALLQWSRQVNLGEVFVHTIIDETEEVAEIEKILARVKKESKNLNENIHWGSLGEAGYAMDRSGHWEKTQAVIDTLCQVEAHGGTSELRAGDAVIFFNHRGDGLRQLARALAAKTFDKFPRPVFLKDITFSSLTTYGRDLAVAPIFTAEKIGDGLAQIVSQKFLKQLHLGDAGSYAHITENFNGSAQPVTGEQDILTASDDWLPKLLRAVLDEQYDFIAAGFTSVDLAADEDDFDNLKRAIKTVDDILGVLAENILSKGGVLVVTSDHGNADDFIDLQTGEIKRGNSLNPVPMMIIGERWRMTRAENKAGAAKNLDLSLIRPQGSLIDVAPTILKILQIRKPRNLEGRALI